MAIRKHVLIISDLHLPWCDFKKLNKVHKYYESHKDSIDLVVCLGDLTDQKIWSKWSKDEDDYCPSKEFKLADKSAKKLYKMFPKMVILSGNHDFRIKKRAIEAGIPSRMFNDIHELWNFKGWKWIKPGQIYSFETRKGKVCCLHGDEFGGKPHIKSQILGSNLICGHSHKASCIYTTLMGKTIYAAECGCLVNSQSKATRYAVRNPTGNTNGFAVIKDGIFQFKPL